jgi:uncharacterized protein (TIGR03437 family)
MLRFIQLFVLTAAANVALAQTPANSSGLGTNFVGLTGVTVNAVARGTAGAIWGAAAWNQDGTPNSASNPAHVGDIVTFYGTGAGQMTPTPPDGTIPQSPVSATSLMPLTGFCTTTYSGDAPGLIEGIFQYNCRVFAAGQTTSIPFLMTSILSTYSSQSIYTVYVK